jgi:hypothetical protein
MLLGIIIIIVFISNRFYVPMEEGFEGISYNNCANRGDSVIFPRYSETARLEKFYDSIYIDPINGSIVQFFGAVSDANNVSDTNGATLTDMTVISKMGEYNSYKISANDPIVDNTYDTTSEIASKKILRVYPQTETPLLSNPYTIISMTSNSYTTVYVQTVSEFKMSGLMNVDLTNSDVNKRLSLLGITCYDTSNYIPEIYIEDADVSNNTFVSNMEKAPVWYQVSTNVFFDTNTQIVYIKTPGIPPAKPSWCGYYLYQNESTNMGICTMLNNDGVECAYNSTVYSD